MKPFSGILKNSFCFVFCLLLIGFGYSQSKTTKANNGRVVPSGSYCKIDKYKQVYSKETSIDDYSFFLFLVRQKYGENSTEYLSLLPDTATFRKEYGFAFPIKGNEAKLENETNEQYFKRLMHLPMIAITKQQAESFCYWMDTMPSGTKQKFHYSLPDKTDYEKMFKKAKITKQKPTMLMSKKKYALTGITDNVAEYTQDGFIVAGGENDKLQFSINEKNISTPIGFRVKQIKVK